jgi:hypothetical protein
MELVRLFISACNAELNNASETLYQFSSLQSNLKILLALTRDCTVSSRNKVQA